MKAQYTIQRPVKVGIYDAEYTARVYAGKIITVSPYVRWRGNTGGYAERREAIHDQTVVDAVLADLHDGAEHTAWQTIGAYLGDDWLEHA
jgi:hypothetical protein